MARKFITSIDSPRPLEAADVYEVLFSKKIMFGMEAVNVLFCENIFNGEKKTFMPGTFVVEENLGLG